ncbi:TPA: hypothetical protein N0H21_001282 [Pseudomonas aeruginosa]|nr:hypothetical protein [Pseudomonas aeruginosa]
MNEKEEPKRDFNGFLRAIYDLPENASEEQLANKIHKSINSKETEELNIESKSIEAIFNSTSTKQVEQSEFLIWSFVKAIQEQTENKTMFFLDTTTASRDKETKTVRFYFNDKEEIIFTLHYETGEFYAQEKSNLNKWYIKDCDRKTEKEEYRKLKIMNAFLLSIANVMNKEDFMDTIKRHIKNN